MTVQIINIFAFVFFCCATFGAPSHPRWGWLAAGLLFWFIGEKLPGLLT